MKSKSAPVSVLHMDDHMLPTNINLYPFNFVRTESAHQNVFEYY